MEIVNLKLALAALIGIGFVGAIMARRVGVPMITGYLVIGMLLSPSVTPLLPQELLTEMTHIITPLALGIIAYLIGGSLYLPNIARFGRVIAVITLFQGIGPWIGVALLITFVGPWLITTGVGDSGSQNFLIMGIVGGAISLATAPAGTMAVIREYRAKGPLTTIMLSVVALDDGLAIVATAAALALVSALVGGGASVAQLFLGAAGEIVFSLALGVVVAGGLIHIAKHTRRRAELLLVVFAAIILCIGAAQLLHLSYLMANMALGFVVVNWMKDSSQIFSVVYDVEELLYAIFFTLVGAKLDLSLLATGGVLAMLIVLGRMGGKFLGSALGATLSGAPPQVRRYLGLALLPKAGVTVGLALLVGQDPRMAGVSEIFINGILASTIMNQLISPPLVKLALVKSGEAGQVTEDPGAGVEPAEGSAPQGA
jgi:Kef-type K+ transport system membrane component KefB